METIPVRLYEKIEAQAIPGQTITVTLPWVTMGVTSLSQRHLGIPNVYAWINAREFSFIQARLPSSLEPVEDFGKNTLARLFLRSQQKHIRNLAARIGEQHDANLSRAWFRSQAANICLFPSWFVPWYKGQLPNTVMTGFPLFSRPGREALDDGMNIFLQAGEGPVVFYNASWRSDLADYFRAAAQACSDLGVRGVFLSRDPAAKNFASETILVRDYADFAALLPQSSAIVHHGGLGTVAAALASGTPQLILPWVNDQPFNAKSVVRLGAGLSLSPRKDEGTGEKLRLLLQSEPIKHRCEMYARRLAGGPDYGTAIQKLESIHASTVR